MTPPTETSETTGSVPTLEDAEYMERMERQLHRHGALALPPQRPTHPIQVVMTLTSYPPYRAEVQSISCSGPALSAGAVSYLSALLRAIDTWAGSVQTDG